MSDNTTTGITRSCNHNAPLKAILGAPTLKAKTERDNKASSTRVVGSTPRCRALRNARALPTTPTTRLRTNGSQTAPAIGRPVMRPDNPNRRTAKKNPETQPMTPPPSFPEPLPYSPVLMPSFVSWWSQLSHFMVYPNEAFKRMQGAAGYQE